MEGEEGGGAWELGLSRITRWGADWDAWGGGGRGGKGIFYLFFGGFFCVCVFFGVTHMHAHSREMGGSVEKDVIKN